jgi:hypothetical protein
MVVIESKLPFSIPDLISPVHLSYTKQNQLINLGARRPSKIAPKCASSKQIVIKILEGKSYDVLKVI